MISLSIVQLAATVYVTAIVNQCGNPGGSRNYYLKRKENISHECLWTVNNALTFHMNTHFMGPTVVWPEGRACCVCVRLGGISCGAPILSMGSSGGQSFKTAQLGLGQWQWHTEAVDFWHTAVTNCEEKVRDICSGTILKDMEIQPTSPGYNLAQMKSLNHEYSEGEQLFTAANLAFMGVILVVTCRELMFKYISPLSV